MTSPTSELESLLQEGVTTGVFPSAQAVVMNRGRKSLTLVAGDATQNTVYDLASLTKVMATTPLFLKLWSQGKVGPHTELQRFFPEAAPGITLADLLLHRSGLPAFIPFFVDEYAAHPELKGDSASPELRAKVREHVIQRAAATAPIQPPCASAVYSDVGFILLGEALSLAAGMPLDEAYDSLVAKPFQSAAKFRRISKSTASSDAPIAPTGKIRPREPAPGQENLWPHIPTVPTRPGQVDDDNAFAMDGVSGHAGLFGTAHDVASFGQYVLDELEGFSRIAPSALWMRALIPDPNTPHSTRRFGFDTPSPTGSSAGSSIGNQPPGAIGHLGFTGVSLWIDRARGLSIALCTNRTYNGRANTRITEFRPRFHDAVAALLDTDR